MTQTHHLPLAAGLPALLLAPTVDRLVGAVRCVGGTALLSPPN